LYPRIADNLMHAFRGHTNKNYTNKHFQGNTVHIHENFGHQENHNLPAWETQLI